MRLFDNWHRARFAANASNADRDESDQSLMRGWPKVMASVAFIGLAGGALSQPAAAATLPTVKLSASPGSVSSGGSSTLTWSATDATSCAASGGWSGTLATSGSKSTGELTAARTYTVTCKGAGGSTAETKTIYLSSEVPDITFTATPTTVKSGGYTTLTWSATNSDGCHAYGPWSGSEPVKGSSTTNGLTATATFILGCFNASGASSSAKVTVTVSGASGTSTEGTATLSWAAPTTNTNGTPVTPLKGYTIYYGTSEGSMSHSLVVSGGSSTSAEISGLTAGLWYFAVAADAQDGAQSAKSSIGSLEI
jgi:hypothetical protein